MASAHALPVFDVAVVSDGEPQGNSAAMLGLFQDEILNLTEGEFDVRFKTFESHWTAASIQSAMAAAYADPDIDLVVVLGISANQLLIGLETFAKPSFLPLVFDGQLLDAPANGNSSGKRNLNYLTDELDFDEDVRAMRLVVPFHRATLIGDEIVISAAPHIPRHATRLAAEIGVEMDFVGHQGGSVGDLLSRLPKDSEAIIVAALPRMQAEEYDELIEALIQRRMPMFSLVGGSRSVARGLLASDAVGQDWVRLARRNALNMQAVMLGALAEDQPIQFEGKRELTINMETARRIGVSPRFDVLSEAVLINQEPVPTGPSYSLVSVARLAVERNLDLLAQRFSVDAGSQDVAEARSAFLPQASIGSSYSRRRVTPLVESGQFAERSLDASVNLNQTLYSDDIWARKAIQYSLQMSREAALEQTRLDIIQLASTAFLDVLRAETRLRIAQSNLGLSRTNLDLARDRVQVGSSSPADLYRWQSQMATARSDLLATRAVLLQAREALNRLLNLPLTEPFQILTPKLDDPFVFSEAEFRAVVDNPRRWELLIGFQAERGLERSPEIQQIATQVDAKARELTNLKRDYWLPDFGLSGQYSDNLDQAGTGVGVLENQGDWNVQVTATLPLFSGGARRARVSRAESELQQLTTQQAAVRERVEQTIRATMHSVNASYVSIRLSREAADASRKNLELVTDQYAQGVVSIIELLDAQNSSLQADEAAENAINNFLVDVMAAQRASGQFDFSLSDDQQKLSAQQIRDYFARIEGADPR
jgi:outer membrane protein TolC